jgi:dTDP-4-dehydrorhamnose reductase
MKILVFGASGMLGQDLCALVTKHEIVGLSHQEADITNREQVKGALKIQVPDQVILTAAFTDVDGAESRKESCFKINVEGTGIVAEETARLNIPLLFISTDYVFSSKGPRPHMENEVHRPLNVYGHSKSKGESCLLNINPKGLVVRTSWLFGQGGKNFCKTMLDLAESKEVLKVVDDQIGAPTWTGHLATALVKVCEKNLRGQMHLCATGQASWYDLAREIFLLAGLSTKVIPCRSEEFERPARRPQWSVLDQKTARENGIVMPSWQEGVKAYLDLIGRSQSKTAS